MVSASLRALVAAGLVVAIAALGGASSFAQKYLTTSVSQRVGRDLRHTLYQHLEHLSLSYYDHQKLGELLSRLTTDVAAVQDLVADALMGVAGWSPASRRAACTTSSVSS